MSSRAERIAEKHEREWIASKDFAIAQYTKQVDTMVDRLLRERANMVASYTESLKQGGAWEQNVTSLKNSGKAESEYADALSVIDEFSAGSKSKVAEDYNQKVLVAGKLVGFREYLKANTKVGEYTTPSGLADRALDVMLIGALNSVQDDIEADTQYAEIYRLVEEYLKTNLGFPAIT